MHCHNCENWPQRSGKKPTLNQRLTVPKTIKKDDTGQTTSDQSEDDFQLSVLFLHVVSFSLSHTHTTFCLKKLWPTGCQRRDLTFAQTSTLLPYLLATETNQTSLSITLGCLLAFGQQAARPHILVRLPLCCMLVLHFLFQTKSFIKH